MFIPVITHFFRRKSCLTFEAIPLLLDAEQSDRQAAVFGALFMKSLGAGNTGKSMEMMLGNDMKSWCHVFFCGNDGKCWDMI